MTFRTMDAELEQRADEIKRLQDENQSLKMENQELNRLFDLQHTRTGFADKLWQRAHNKPGIWPDLGELIGWLLSQRDALQQAVTTLVDSKHLHCLDCHQDGWPCTFHKRFVDLLE
jgi:DNA repair exonuclease SbcCD ATPase subunit